MAKRMAEAGKARRRRSFNATTTELSFPESTYLIDAARDLIYIPVPKVASTSLKIWFLSTSPDVGVHPDPASWKVNAWLGAEGSRYLLNALAPLRDRRIFKFAFVRNPWSRLVSSYLNRIVDKGVEYRNVMKRLSRGPWFRLDKRMRYYARKWACGVGWPESAEITFREFVVRELCAMPAMDMDPHWRPQYSFLGSHEPDFIGRFERLAEDLAALCDRLGAAPDLPALNRSRYAARHDGGCFADCTQAELRAMKAMPGYRQFYTPELVDMVAKVYAKDIERFGYDF
jgi:hypothetical protein